MNTQIEGVAMLVTSHAMSYVLEDAAMSHDTPNPHVIQIPLTQGYVAIVDEIDADLAQSNWHVSAQATTRYAVRNKRTPKGQRLEQMHRIILSRILGRRLKRGEYTDHINHDGFDNRRCNLRVASRSENGRNRRKPSQNTSGYKGVGWDKTYQCWTATLTVEGETIKLKNYATAEAAARAYNHLAKKYHGKFACLNIVEGDYE
jgi:hypothetical protein